MARVFRIQQLKVYPDEMCLIINPNQQKGCYKIKFNPRSSMQFKVVVWVAERMKEQRDKGQDIRGVQEKEFLKPPYKIGETECRSIYKNWQHGYKDKYNKLVPKPKQSFEIFDKKDKIIKDYGLCRKIVELLFHVTPGHRKPKEERYYWLGYYETKIEFETPGAEDDIAIPKIEHILNKYHPDGGKFFRAAGPEWIDFEKRGFVADRKEVDEIINRFQNKDIITIKGTPASGKSSVLRHIGFKLANQGKEVYVIELKKQPYPQIENVLKMKNGYLFIDDAHLNLAYVDDIVQNLSSVKVLISIRDIEERFGPTYPRKITEYIMEADEIKGYDIAEDIIQKFSEMKRKIPDNIKVQLTRNNLWTLAWQLESYEESYGVNEDSVNKRVMNYMRKDLKDLGVRKAEDVFLPLSIFYRYEIPLRKEFIENLAMSDDINRLLELNEINEIEENGFEYLILHHSEIAKVFLKAFQKLEGLGNDVKQKMGDDWLVKLFYIYIESFPGEIVKVVSVGHNFCSPEIGIIPHIVEVNSEILKKALQSEDDFHKVCGCFYSITLSPIKVVGELIPTVANRVIQQGDIENISAFFDISTITVSDKVTKRLMEHLDFEKLKRKLEREPDIEKIGECLGIISMIHTKIVYNFIPLLKKRVDDENDIEKIALCIDRIIARKAEVAKRLIESLDFEKIRSKLEAETDIGKITSCIRSIAIIDERKRLITNLDLDSLKIKLQVEDNVEKIGWFTEAVTWASKDFANKIIPLLKSKIEDTSDVEKISEAIKAVAWSYKTGAKRLVTSLDFNFKKDLEKIITCIQAIIYTYDSEEIPNHLNSEKLKSNLKSKEDIKKILDLLP